MAAFLAPAGASASTPARLLARYQPVAVLEPSELFRPTYVEAFLTAAALEQRAADGPWLAVPSPPALPTSDPPGCPSPGASACWRLNVAACSPAVGLASLQCYAGVAPAEGRSVVYGRFLEAGNRIVLQYWFFYVYNLWSPRFPPDEFIWRTHEGDWEVVTVVLSRNEKPLYVGYSQHCTGKRRSWAKVPKWRGTQHPVAYVALGSHGNYFSPGPQSVDLSCWPQAAAVIFRAHRVTALDFTGRGAILGPARAGIERSELRRVDVSNPSWLRFPGTWGEQGFFHAPEPVGTVAFGAGPDSPAHQRAWRQPLKTVLGWRLG